MPHDVETMAYAARDASSVPWWVRLGLEGQATPITPGMTPAEMQEAAGLGWALEKRPLGYLSPEQDEGELVGDSFIPVEQNAWVRSSDGAMLAIGGKDWRPMQNEAAFEFFRNWAEAGGVEMETAGSLKGGRIIWAMARLAEPFGVGVDQVQSYLRLNSRHEYGSAITIDFTTVVQVCANTLAYGDKLVAAGRKGNLSLYRQDHTKDFDEQAAKDAVMAAHDGLAAIEKTYRRLAKIKIGVEQAVRDVLIPVRTGLDYEQWAEEQREKIANGVKGASLEPKWLRDIKAAIALSPGAESRFGTAWGVLNGVTNYCDHSAGKQPDTRLANAWYGSNAAFKTDIEKRLLELA